MQEESIISESELFVNVGNRGFHDFKLLKTTANARLYRASKQGKLFLIKTTKDNSERQLQMLKREHELSICCSHHHIVSVYTYEENLEVGEGIVMEYIEGCTLTGYLAKKRSRRERIRLFEELLSAVGYLHKQGIIHNDLKPDNILISHTDDSLKLIDLGLADNDAYYVLKTLGCTPRYASPELREQRGALDARSDIYSVGVIMRMLLGNSAIARRCTRSNPDRRYSNVEALQKAWRNRYLPLYILLFTLFLFLIGGLIYAYVGVVDRNRQLQTQQAQQEQQIQEMQQEQQTQVRQLKEMQQEQQLREQQLQALEEESKKQQQQKQRQQQMAAKIKRDLATIYEKRMALAKKCTSFDDAGKQMVLMEQEFSAYIKQLLGSINEVEMRDFAHAHYTRIVTKYGMDCQAFMVSYIGK